MILLIDHYDSFVYNLDRYLVEMGCETRVVRGDRLTLADVRSMNPAAIVLSPGPCTPREVPFSIALVRELSEACPMLGVCLGYQIIAAAMGGEIVRAPEPVHGRTSPIYHSEGKLFSSLENPLQATRYHSLIVDESSLPDELTVTARTAEGLIMAVEHKTLPLYGVQFHPESVLTEQGPRLLHNFLRLAGIESRQPTRSDFVDRREIDPWPHDRSTRNQPLHW